MTGSLRNLHLAFGGVIAKVDSDADDFAEAAYWRSQTKRRLHAWSGVQVIDGPGAQSAQAITREKFCVVIERGIRTKARNLDARAILEQNSRSFLARITKADRFHAVGSPIAIC